MLTWLPIPLLVVTVTALILVDERTPPGAPRNVRWVMVWKPLSTLLVILIAALSFMLPGAHDIGYSLLVLLGLLLSLAGDVLLIFPSHRAFLAGLIAFLSAHLAYIAAFVYVQVSRSLGANVVLELVAAVVLAVIGAAVYLYLRPKLGRMRVPVILYMLVISAMVHRALAVVFMWPAGGAFPVLVVAGALLFYLSDAILAVDRFKLDGSMPHGHVWNLSTYYAGQLLIALSASALTL
jgi:uncharacterized membrane protein YhhN